MNCDVILLYVFVCLFVFFAGVGAQAIITMYCKYNSAEQGTTTTSGLHYSLKREPSTRGLYSLDSFVGQTNL